jgi:hypothetical protein
MRDSAMSLPGNEGGRSAALWFRPLMRGRGHLGEMSLPESEGGGPGLVAFIMPGQQINGSVKLCALNLPRGMVQSGL